MVCGAPNARAGMVGVFGPPGAYVPGSDMTLKVAAIRGVESNGMMCSVRELELGDEHDGIIELPPTRRSAPRSPTIAGLDDPVFDVAVTPNRPDCMGVRGIARDLAAAGIGTLKPLADPAGRGQLPVPGRDPHRRSRGLPGLLRPADPRRAQRRQPRVDAAPPEVAPASGRSRRVVDITNYVMLDLGRPTHAYDVAKLDGALVARRAAGGRAHARAQRQEYALDPSMTVIADDSGVHDIGGIMGGEHSGVTEATTDVMLEVAYFDPERIARTGQKLGADQRRPQPLRARRRPGLPRAMGWRFSPG